MKLRVTVDGTGYDVEVEILEESGGSPHAPAPPPAYSAPPQPAGIAPPLSPSSPPSRAGNALASPIPGTVVEIKVSAGQSVNAGETVIVLDAMKMNTPVGASMTGKIKEVLVKTGEPVKMGQPLLTFE